jgi:hypothetical protein
MVFRWCSCSYLHRTIFNIAAQSDLAELFRFTRLILIDEAGMLHRQATHTTNYTMMTRFLMTIMTRMMT